MRLCKQDHYLGQGGSVFPGVGFSVCLQDYIKSTRLIFTKLFGSVHTGGFEP